MCGKMRGFMTKTKYSVAFKDGILTSYDANRPSELLEVARTPMRIVNGLFDGVSKIISLRTGENNANASLSASESALLQAQYNLLAGGVSGQKQLTDAELALLQSQFGLLNGQTSGLTQLSAADLALLQAQTNLTLSQNNSRTQISASDLAAMIATLRDQARRDAVNKCIGEKVSNGEAIESCFANP